MHISIHRIEKIRTSQLHHSDYGNDFYCLRLDITTEDEKEVEIRLFSSQPMTLVNPEIKVSNI